MVHTKLAVFRTDSFKLIQRVSKTRLNAFTADLAYIAVILPTLDTIPAMIWYIVCNSLPQASLGLSFSLNLTST